jgi:hypothetical protein
VLFLIQKISCTNEYLSQDFTTTNPQDLLKVNIPILGDSLFNDVITYINDELWQNPMGKTGIQKCKEECKGRCVEYGISRQAMCFPK